jgi:hypothetical protein
MIKKVISIWFVFLLFNVKAQERILIIENIGFCESNYKPIGFYDSINYHKNVTFPEDFFVRSGLVPFPSKKLDQLDSLIIIEYQRLSCIVNENLYKSSQFQIDKTIPTGTYRFVSYSRSEKLKYDFIILGKKNAEFFIDSLIILLNSFPELKSFQLILIDEIEVMKSSC